MHIQNVWEATNRFLELVLQHLTDDDTREKILRLWLNPIMSQKLDTAYNKLDELLEVHKEHPLTTNHHFLDNRRKLQQKSNQEQLQEMLNREFVKPTQKLSVEDVSRLMSNLNTAVNPDMDMAAAEDAFDNMNAYYEVAISPFHKVFFHFFRSCYSGRNETIYGQCPDLGHSSTDYSKT
jgi:CBS-domain-containing membrane protein